MATKILDPGSTADNSSTFTLAEGETATISLFPASGSTFDPRMLPSLVTKQASNSAWVATRTVLGFDSTVEIVSGAGFTLRATLGAYAAANGYALLR